MNCREVTERLDELLEDRLSAAELQRLENHLEQCPQCRKLVSLSREEAPLGTEEDAEALISGIMERTSGSACTRAESMLASWVDGETGGTEGELLDQHLAHCPACLALATTFSRMKPLLRDMAELKPDRRFTTDVMAVTVGRRLRTTRPSGFRQWMEGMLRSPRLAWEVSYVVAVVLMTLFVAPVSPLKDVLPRALEWVETPRVTAAAVIPGVQTAGGYAGRLGDSAYRFVERYVTEGGEQVMETGRKVAGAGRYLGQALEEGRLRLAPRLNNVRTELGHAAATLFQADFTAFIEHVSQAGRLLIGIETENHREIDERRK